MIESAETWCFQRTSILQDCTLPQVSELTRRQQGTIGVVILAKNEERTVWRGGDRCARCAESGADLLNDTWDGWDPAWPKSRVEFGQAWSVPCGRPAARMGPFRVSYGDVRADVLERALVLADRAVRLGVDPERIIMDPAHGFGNHTWHSLELARGLGEVTASGWPVLLSASHKDFAGETLGAGVEDRLAGTLAVASVEAWLGARIFGADNVAETLQALYMVSAIKGRPEAGLGHPQLAEGCAVIKSRVRVRGVVRCPGEYCFAPVAPGPVDHLTISARDRAVSGCRDDLASPGDVCRCGRKTLVRRAHLTRVDAQLAGEPELTACSRSVRRRSSSAKLVVTPSTGAARPAAAAARTEAERALRRASGTS